jgi:predicted nucleic acid-binding protein
MTLVIDASVAIKWYVEQPDSEAAKRLAAGGAGFVAPEVMLAEAGSALWKYVRAGQMTVEQARTVLEKIPGRFDTLFPLSPLADEALQIAVAIRHPIYDCFYLALAKREGAPLVTADKRLAALGQSVSGVEVRLLGG